MTRRLLASVPAALVLAAALGACAKSSAPPPIERSATALDRIRPVATAPEPTLPAQVIGDDGVEVTVADTSRIVPLNGGIAEIVFSLGLGRSVVARDVTTTFPEASALPVMTNGHSISAEGLIAQRPTVVLADSRTGPKSAIAQLRGAGIKVVIVPRALQLDQVNARIRAVAAAVGLPEQGDALVRRTDAEIAAVKPPAGTTPVRVAFLYLRGSAAVYLLGGRGSGADGMIETLRAVDVGAAAGLGDFSPMTAEALVKAAPDVILVMTEGLASVGGVDGLLNLNGVAQTPAGRERRVVAVDDGLLLNFGPRTPAALKRLADGLAPFRT